MHGSGPQDRDETIGPNKPFKNIAEGLADLGIATLRYDKRTKAYGLNPILERENITLDIEVVDDVLAAIHLAAKTEQINPSRIYIAGHSLGAMAAPRIAERAPQLAGIIMLAGNARPLEDLIVEQIKYLSFLSSDSNPEMIEKLKKEAENVKRLKAGTANIEAGFPFDAPTSYWESLNNYDQLKTIEKLELPILVLQGERDYQVTMEDYYLWKKILATKKNARCISYPALNHLFLEGQGKSTPSEYYTKGQIPEYVFDDIASFINADSINKEK